MLSQRAIDLQKKFENLLMDSGCDTTLESAIEYLGDADSGCGSLEVRQAWYKAVLYVASAHIENCFDSALENKETKNTYLDPQRYIDWMNEQLKNASVVCCGK